MVDTTYYTNLITSQHASKPKFLSTVQALVRPFVDQQNFLQQDLMLTFDLDTAIGNQLDATGLWIGRTRDVSIPISGAYFSWDTSGLGWDQGNWKGPFDSTTGIVALDDQTFRNLLRAKIVINGTDGTIATAARAIAKLFSDFPDTIVSIKDNQDMTMTVSISGVVPPAVYLTLLDNNELVISPTGVSTTFTVTSVNTVSLFGWDTENATIKGWDEGAWSGTLGVGPGQVTNLALVSKTANTATISYQPPLVGTAPLSYQVEMRQAGTTGPFQIYGDPVSLTMTTISGLIENQSYEFQVYAVNPAGAGLPSPPLTVATNASGAPQVTGLKSTTIGTTSITLIWDSLGSGITYTVQDRISGQGTFATVGTTTSATYAVGNLAAATLYDFQVYATNTTASGPPSTVLTAGTTGALPGAVQNLTVAAPDANTATLTWTPPATGATGVNLTYSVLQAVNVTPITYQAVTGLNPTTAPDGTVSVTVPNLSGNVSYLFQVYASNPSGNGPTSAPVSITTPVGPPAEVTGLALVSDTSTSATISWKPVLGAAQYQVQYQQEGASNWTNGPLVTTTSATVTLSSNSTGTGVAPTSQNSPFDPAFSPTFGSGTASTVQTTIPTPTPKASGTRHWYDQPGTEFTFWNTPIGSGATYSAATDADTKDLVRLGAYINPPDNYGSPIYVATSSTTNYTITANIYRTLQIEDGTQLVNPTFNILQPAGATGAGPQPMFTDQALTMIDTVTAANAGKYFFCGPTDINNLSSNITINPGKSGDPYAGSGFYVENTTLDIYATQQEMLGDASTYPYNVSAGVIRGYDIDPARNPVRIPGTSLPRISHVMRYSLDPSQCKAVGSGQGLVNMPPTAWPCGYEDFQTNNNNAYTGNIAYGSHLAIPPTTAMPTTLTDAGKQLWDAAVNFGCSIHDVSGGGLHLFADQDVCSQTWYNDALIDIATIKDALRIVRNQHVGGSNFVDNPVNGPGARLCARPDALKQISGSPVPSANYSYVTAQSTTPITDTFGNQWSVNQAGQVAVKKAGATAASADTSTSNVTTVAYADGVIYHENTQGLWYCKTGPWQSWSPGSSNSPLPASTVTPPPVTPPPTVPDGGVTYNFRVYAISN